LGNLFKEGINFPLGKEVGWDFIWAWRWLLGFPKNWDKEEGGSSTRVWIVQKVWGI